MTNTQVKSAQQLEIIIVGAGLGGLATAIVAKSSGHRVKIFEAADELQEVGAGLQVTPNATRILQQIGVSKQLWESAAEPTTLTVHQYSGKILAHENDFDKHIRAKYDAPFVDLHRGDLQLALFKRAEEVGVSFKFGERVNDMNLDTSEISTNKGTKATADLIIAADGLWSPCRACMTGSDERPRPTGDLAYRIVLDLENVQDPELRQWINKPTVHFWIGPGAHAVGYSLRAGQQYNIVLLVPDDLPSGVSRQTGSLEEMKDLFKGWDPILSRFLDLVQHVDKWKLMYRDELTSWVSEQSNLVFVGDACHPMLPYLGQGANSAVEDGATLGTLLGYLQSKKQLPQLLKLYEKMRKRRADAIVRETFKQREAFHMPNGPEQEARDQIFLSQLGKEIKGAFPSRWTCPQVQPWLYGYDALKEAAEAGRRFLNDNGPAKTVS